MNTPPDDFAAHFGDPVFIYTRRRIIGHFHLSTGTLDTCFIHPREIFRTVILAGASTFVLTHNHPTGDATPS